MPIDHSVTYKDKKIRNLPHILRLNTIFKILDSVENKEPFCDVGCSNGYITNLIAENWRITDATGLDYNKENLSTAQRNYSHITFNELNLNIINNSNNKYKLVTCFETLEHAGNLNNALTNLIKLVEDGETILISVPIEVGIIGILKFLTKTIIYRYDLDEINTKNERYFYAKYLLSLLTLKDISKFRGKSEGFGTHFGFDYRLVGRWLKDKNFHYRKVRKATTVFYIIKATTS